MLNRSLAAGALALALVVACGQAQAQSTPETITVPPGANAYDALWASKQDLLALPLPIAQGGCGATTVAGCIANLGIGSALSSVLTNAVLSTTKTTEFPLGVWRLDFATGNNAPPLLYVPSASACSLNAGAGDNGSQVASADGKCWIASFPSAGADVREWGSKCDGVNDDHDTLQAALNAASITASPVALPGNHVCNFGSPLTFPVLNNLTIFGQGNGSVLNYAGANTTNDIISVGTPSTYQTGNLYSNFRIASSTHMTGGAAFHLYGVDRSYLNAVIIDGQDGNHNLYNGIWFDGVDDTMYINFTDMAQNDILRVNGRPGLGLADLYIDHCKIGGGAVGVHIGGDFGGFQSGMCGIIGNGINVAIDTALYPVGNREILFNALTDIDSSTSGPGVYINDELAGGAAWLEFNGTWIASSQTCGVQIAPLVQYNIQFTGGNIFNSTTDGICNASTADMITINGTVRRNNQGYGFNQTGAPNPNIGFPSEILNVTSYGNTLGDYNGVTPTTNNVILSTIANGAHQDLPLWAGIIVVDDIGTGDVGMYVCGVQICTLLASGLGTFVASTTSPPGGKASVAFDVANSCYAIYNNTGSSTLFSSTILSVRSFY
ncbi:MAG: hypothetical protein WAN43_16165 [Rhodomicrobium sp.]